MFIDAFLESGKDFDFFTRTTSFIYIQKRFNFSFILFELKLQFEFLLISISYFLLFFFFLLNKYLANFISIRINNFTRVFQGTIKNNRSNNIKGQETTKRGVNYSCNKVVGNFVTHSGGEINFPKKMTIPNPTTGSNR